MSLNVIGSGFGRTGTMSTKMALETLGFSPCHHMTEVLQCPTQLPFWKACVDGDSVDWTQVFDGFKAQVDFPGAAVWEHIAPAFPDAKVLHNERPEEDWWASYSVTIGKFFAVVPTLPVPPDMKAIFTTMDKLLVQGVFGGRTDKKSCIAAYRHAGFRDVPLSAEFPTAEPDIAICMGNRNLHGNGSGPCRTRQIKEHRKCCQRSPRASREDHPSAWPIFSHIRRRIPAGTTSMIRIYGDCRIRLAKG